MRSHSKPVITIGVDPASAGAAVILSDRVAVSAICWRKRTRKKKRVYEVTEARKGENPTITIVNTAGGLGEYIWNLPELSTAREEGNLIDFVIEDTYVGRNLKTSLIVAKFSGCVAGHIEAKLDKAAVWVKAAVWRHKLLFLNPFLKREKAKKSSLELIPNLLCDMNILIDKLGAVDHLTDAAGLALWHYQTNHEQEE